MFHIRFHPKSLSSWLFWPLIIIYNFSKVRQLEQAFKVSTRKIELLEKYIRNVTSTNTLHKMTLSDFLAQFQEPAAESEAANNITSLLDFYQEHMTAEEIKKLEIENQIKELKSSLSQIDKKISELSSVPGEVDKSIQVQKQAGVYVEAKENGTVELKFSYLVCRKFSLYYSHIYISTYFLVLPNQVQNFTIKYKLDL